MTYANHSDAPLFLELRPGTRKALANAVEAFIELLNQFDGDADLEDVNEDGGDILNEPHDEDTDLEDGGDAENTALERHGAGFLRSGGDDMEDSHDREQDILDAPHDAEPDEPSLGSLGGTMPGCVNFNQMRWADGEDFEPDSDAEPPVCDLEGSGCVEA